MSLPARAGGFWHNVWMPPSSSYRIELTVEERAALVALIRPSGQARMVLRARIVLAAADGRGNTRIARDVGVCDDTVRKWRRRYADARLAGLADAPRSGRPSRFSPVQRAQVVALACELPASRGMPLSRWSSFELACEAIEAGIVVDISSPTVARWLTKNALKPWQYRSWIAPRAPDFASKAAVVLDLYARVWDGQPSGPDDYVLCSDELGRAEARRRDCSRYVLQPGKRAGSKDRHRAPVRPNRVAGGVTDSASGNARRSGRGRATRPR